MPTLTTLPPELLLEISTHLTTWPSFNTLRLLSRKTHTLLSTPYTTQTRFPLTNPELVLLDNLRLLHTPRFRTSRLHPYLETIFHTAHETALAAQHWLAPPKWHDISAFFHDAGKLHTQRLDVRTWAYARNLLFHLSLITQISPPPPILSQVLQLSASRIAADLFTACNSGAMVLYPPPSLARYMLSRNWGRLLCAFRDCLGEDYGEVSRRALGMGIVRGVVPFVAGLVERLDRMDGEGEVAEEVVEGLREELVLGTEALVLLGRCLEVGGGMVVGKGADR
ncbi:hypothetical protein BJ508DRAFT_347804 [Ascobolus immersus RN42]|uniref:F-box domain-containing protein n=1 Tax=Ascobolus immersus RN42 TaxID=1160509 RepID=A0A3N4IKH0_ASCIM|nr:hypothetical protein BJ508DRAFT_347804 [Ascobolus immersus RN42]